MHVVFSKTSMAWILRWIYLRSEPYWLFYQSYYQSPFYQSYSKEDIFWFDYFLT